MADQFVGLLFVSIGILLMAGIVAAVSRLVPFIYDYRFHHRRVDVVMFGGRVVVWKIDNINNAYLINAFNPVDWLVGGNRWRRIYRPNRFKLHWLVIHAEGWTIFITPLHPTTALKTIEEGDKE